ncbi:uncharacterized protein LAJ45_05199 [Morchella importuna]|uniref:uncharacterized protein n=1 Tax=Morchella importuna TaxID=1174673 RepID=UPI001E8DDB94|nr:uncharacterized protein LAJ45_05199 [Morchella importuna]KAH8150504.1 hypothetical protein LAJ45_05199 [Morchella importuna]
MALPPMWCRVQYMYLHMDTYGTSMCSPGSRLWFIASSFYNRQSWRSTHYLLYLHHRVPPTLEYCVGTL